MSDKTFDKNRAFEIFQEEQNITEAAKKHCQELGIEYEEKYRLQVSRLVNKNKEGTETIVETNQYDNDKFEEKKFNAIGEDGKVMNIKKYCDHYGLDFDKVRSYKYISHTATPYYNIAFYETVIEPEVDYEEIKRIVKGAFSEVVVTPNKKEGESVGVVKIADLHFGATIDNLIRTKNFDLPILRKYLRKAAEEINKRNYKKVHVHILGDLIESFTGLNHKNAWKGLDKNIIGAKAVKIATKCLHEDFLSLIFNLDKVKIIAGNHDRTTSDKTEDTEGGAAELISFTLELIGYDVEFHPMVIKHIVDDICHIIGHGHLGISKKSTKDICWDYGEQGMFNLICEGHLHSIIEKLSIKQREKFKTIKDDAVDHRRFNCPSFFTGNSFSEYLGYTSTAGFVITENNGNGVPNVFYYAL